MGLWDAIKRSFRRETTKAAVKASAAAVSEAASTAADGFLTEAEEELAQAEKDRAERDDGIVLPSTEVGDPEWLADLKAAQTPAEPPAPAAPVTPAVPGPSAEENAKAQLEALKADLLHIEE